MTLLNTRNSLARFIACFYIKPMNEVNFSKIYLFSLFTGGGIDTQCAFRLSQTRIIMHHYHQQKGEQTSYQTKTGGAHLLSNKNRGSKPPIKQKQGVQTSYQTLSTLQNKIKLASSSLHNINITINLKW